jgi:glycosyltransferase involved in cell wall biosynthesis
MRIAHVTISHDPTDVRIVHKECASLAQAGHEVHCLFCGPPPASANGLHFHSLPEVGRATAYFWQVWRKLPAIYRRARDVRAAVYHLPDPALIPLALMLKLRGARVVYDAHEDRPRQALTKYRALGRPLVGIASSLLWRMLEAAGKLFIDRFVAVTPQIAERFPAGRTTVVRNYPRLEEFAGARRAQPPYAGRPNHVVYTGAVRRYKGVDVTVEAMALLPEELDARLLLIGDFRRAHRGFLAELEQLPGWARVDALGPRPRPEMVEILAGARIGVSLYAPRPEHVHAMGNKAFEYMAVGLPVVASDFPVWREVLRERGAGLTVDPTDPVQVAGAIRHLLEHPARAEAMGAAGAEAVASTFNWSGEAERLVRLYEELDPTRSSGGRPSRPDPVGAPHGDEFPRRGRSNSVISRLRPRANTTRQERSSSNRRR